MFDARLFYSFQAALVFLIVSSPILYTFVQSIFGKLFTVAVKGCPTIAGLILHSVVFALVVYVIMLVQEPKPVAAKAVAVSK